MKEKQSLIKKEWLKLVKEERAYLKKRMDKKDSKLNQLLEKRYRKNYRELWMRLFQKHFSLCLKKGPG